MPKIFWLLFAVAPFNVFCQVTDDFSDGDFTTNPAWTGDNSSNWTISSGRLRSNSSTPSSTFYITTPSSLATVAQWTFSIHLQFNTSGANYVDVYLTSEQANLTSASNNGYFVRIGGTNDEVSFWKMTGGVPSLLIDGINGVTNTSNNLIRISVTRDASHVWTLQRDVGITGTYFTEGTTLDATFLHTSFFGIRITQSTSSFHTKHHFDDFSIGDLITDTSPPNLINVTPISDREVEVLFSEKVDRLSAESSSNYSVDKSVGSAKEAFLQEDERTVSLLFSEVFPNADTSRLTVSNVADVLGNKLLSEEIKFFSFRPVPALARDIIFSEIFADPNPSIGLPEGEFVEIYNRSSKAFDLAGWKFADATAEKVLPSKIIFPGQYVVFVNSSVASDYASFPNVLPIMGFPTLTNTGELLKLVDPSGLVIDSVLYDNDWYRDEEKKAGGYSLERISQENFCVAESENWIASEHLLGGTPGIQNTVLNNEPDVLGPILLSIDILSAGKVNLNFNEKLSNTPLLLNQFVLTPSIELANVFFTDSLLLSLTVEFSEELQPSVVYTLAAYDIQDCTGNLIGEESNATFVLPEVALANDIIITEIFADPSPSIGLPEGEFVEIFNRSKKVIDLTGWKFVDGRTEKILPARIFYPGEYVALVNSSLADAYTSFPNVLPITDFPTLSNTGELLKLKDPSGLVVDSVLYDDDWYKDEEKKAGGYSLERISQENFCVEESENWIASMHALGGTPGSQNTVLNNEPDVVGPKLLSIEILSAGKIKLNFNEKLGRTPLLVNQFLLTPYVDLEKVFFTDSLLLNVIAEFSEELQTSVLYTLTAHDIQDCTGNEIGEENTATFILPEAAVAKDIIITEIFADPNPRVALPEAEFVELYNRSERVVDLKNWKISDGSTQGIMPTHILLPGDFVLVCKVSDANYFTPYGATLALVNFPSLSNTGEPVVLYDSNGTLIDSVNYNLTWYRSEEKETGGWSLELIDTRNICGEGGNWTASENEGGGTPGKENSVKASKPDTTPPQLFSVTPENDRDLLLVFNEKLEKALPAVTSFTLLPSVPVNSVAFTNTSLTELKVSLGGALETKTLYELRIERVYDCAGNEIDKETAHQTFALPEPAEVGDVLLNEILFNPRPSGADFIEVYNHSSKFINIKELRLVNRVNEILINERGITDKDVLLHPYSYLVFSPDVENIKGEYPQAAHDRFFETEIPPMNDEEGSMVLLTADAVIIDELFYSSDMHSALLKEEEGVSLERVSMEESAFTKSNWRSGVASTHFASPGYKNANSSSNSTGQEEVQVEPEVFEPLVGQPNFASIQYKFDRGGLIANAKILDAQGRLVKSLTNNEILGTEGFFTWDGDQEDGSRARIGYYILWMEVFDTSGFVKTFRKRIIIASRF